MAQLHLEKVASPSRSERAFPKLSAIAVSAPQPSAPRKRVASAPCTVAVYKVAGEASRFWEDAPPGCALWQLQVDHPANDSVTVGFYDNFSRFLAESSNTPDTLAELRRSLLKIVITGAKDPGQVRWRPALYVGGDFVALHNSLNLLSEYFEWASTGQALTIDVFPAGVDLDVDELKSMNVHSPDGQPPLRFWECAPPSGPAGRGDLLICVLGGDVAL